MVGIGGLLLSVLRRRCISQAGRNFSRTSATRPCQHAVAQPRYRSQTASAPPPGPWLPIDIGQDMHEIDDWLKRREEYAVDQPDPQPAIAQEGP